MPSSRVQALVRPELLVWARESAGLSVEVAGRKARVKPQRIASWEKGESRPTIHQLRTLGRIYRRPVAVFFLSEVPRTFMPLHDFRRLPGVIAGKESPELRYQIRWARDRREIGLELLEALGESATEFQLSAALSADWEATSTRLREALAITYDEQTGWSGAYEALNAWRSAIESLGVLVFQATGVDLAEMRAFSLAELPLPVIVVNIKDSPRGRIFSMVHEFVHLALREGGLCDLREDAPRLPEEQRVEVACNAIAGGILVPRERLLAETVVQTRRGAHAWSDDDLALLSRRYGVSREVVLRRLLVVGRTTRTFFREKSRQLQEEAASRRERASGFALPHTTAVSSAGHLFARLVLNSYYQERITARDVSDFLGVRLKHMGRVEEAVLGRTVEFGAVA